MKEVFFCGYLIIDRMMSKLVCVLLIFAGFDRYSAQPQCVYENNQVTCRHMAMADVYGNMTALIHEQSVTSLNYKDSNIPVISRSTFGRYKFIHSLDISSSRVRNIEAGAFEDLHILKSLNLRDNYLRKLSSDIFGSPSKVPVEKLDVSCNLLEDLSDFNVTNFSTKLKLNVSRNKLEYLPESFIELLRGDNQFYIVIDENPWNCKHPNWVDLLDPLLIEAFCTNKSYDADSYREQEKRMKAEMSGNVKTVKAGFGNDTELPTCSATACYYYCLLWFFGAIWIGVILGNVCMLKRLLCRAYVPPCEPVTEGTQYDYLILDHIITRRLPTGPR